MSEEASKHKRKAKTEDGPDKKVKLEPSSSTFEVQPEVENFQREALWRSLQDYKRRAAQSQEQLEKLQKSGKYHDEHLRLIDVWWDTFLDEIQIIAQVPKLEPAPALDMLDSHFQDTPDQFSEHLSTKRQRSMNSIITAVQKMREASIPVDIKEVTQQNIELSARVKMSEMRLRELQLEKEEREPRIIDLQEKLASTQRKVDRQKSITLKRIESQAHRMPSDVSNSQVKTEDNVQTSLHEVLDEAKGTNGSQAGDNLSAANQRLLQQLTDLQNRLAELTNQNEDLTNRTKFPKIGDVEQSETYKTIKLSNEHLRGQNDHLEQQNKQALVEITELKAERLKFREALVSEHGLQYEEIIGQLAKAEQDLARVRHARDELHSNMQLRKAQDDTRIASQREISHLADAQATRIVALEAEVMRLKDEGAQKSAESQTNGHADKSSDELLADLERLRRENESLKNELPTMEQAFNQAHEQNMRKVMDLVAAEDKVSRLQAEKSKADQKYFASMKAKDQLTIELKTLKQQAAKNTEALGRLHDTEETMKAKIINLEKQNALESQVNAEYRRELAKSSEALAVANSKLQSSESELKSARTRADSKEQEVAALHNEKRSINEDLESMRTQHEQLKATDSTNSAGESDQLQVYRGIAMCSVCNTRWKDTALTSCGHVFCKPCVDKRVETRQRRCPSCNKGFGSGDVLNVHL